jgi:hypothetical protein
MLVSRGSQRPLAPHAPDSAARRQAGRVLALVCALAVGLLIAGPVLAASPKPVATPAWTPGLTLDAEPMLGGHVRPGAWAAVVVHLTNDGPPISGELRIHSSQQQGSLYGTQIELATGARQDHTLYAQLPYFGSRLLIELVSGETVLAAKSLTVKTHDSYSTIIGVVAEQPQGITGAIADATRNPNGAPVNIVELTPADLPPRVEAWSAIDRLVWQDVDATQLSTVQLEALRLWLGAGGRLTVLGGTTGLATLSGLPDELLPFTPTHTVDVPPAELTGLLGDLPADATSVPALAGVLRTGSVLARNGDEVVAAQSAYGRGTVTLIGFNPAERWITESQAAKSLWRRLLPIGSNAVINPLVMNDDSMVVAALQNLPAVELPPIDQLFVLLVAYIALIGPINYLVLRRLDKREWAWLTMPALVGVFALASYGLGATLKGSDVVVNQIAIVRAGEGAELGIGQVYVGIYSPSRRSFDVAIPGGALISSPTSQLQNGQAQQPLDVLFGETARLRNFEVGFGVLRGFRAEGPADTPRIASDLRLVAGRLQGTITNLSDAALESVAVVLGGGVAAVPRLEAGESKKIDVDTNGAGSYYQLSDRIFGSSYPSDQDKARQLYSRRAVIDQLSNYGPNLGGDSAATPVLLAWQQAAVLDVEISGEEPTRVGDSLYVMPLSMTLDQHAVFGDRLLSRSVVGGTAGQAWVEDNSFSLGRGTMIVEFRPIGLDGRFNVSSLEIALTQGDQRNLRGTGAEIAPLPDEEQPDQDDPLNGPAEPSPEPAGTGEPTVGSDQPGGGGVALAGKGLAAAPAPMMDGLPDFQLFDVSAARWVQFEHPNAARTYTIGQPERYVDGSGRLLIRFVNRGQLGGEEVWFQFQARLEGTIE